MPTLKELERWVGTTEAAKMIGYSRQGTINLAEDKKVRAVKTGAGWIYDPDDLKMFKARLKASKGIDYGAATAHRSCSDAMRAWLPHESR